MAERVKDKVDKEYIKLEALKDTAARLLDEVLADSSLTKHHADARTYQADIAKYWKRITRMTKSVRGTNHPVVKFIVDAGNAAHEEYQKDASKCDEYEFSVPGGRVDCLKVDDSGCWIIELKPDNRASINKGSRQLYRYTRELTKGNDARACGLSKIEPEPASGCRASGCQPRS